MRYATTPATGQVVIVEAPIPTIGPGELLVKLEIAALCGTDVLKVNDPATVRPVALGHEIVGRIAQIGPGVTGFQLDQRVVVAHHVPDFSSHYSQRGRATMDPHFKASGLDPCGLADFIRVPAEHTQNVVFPVPAGMPSERAVLTEPFACVVRALDRPLLKEGDTALVIGIGSVSLMFLALFHDRAIRTLVSARRPDRADLARAWGAEQVLTSQRDDVAATVRAATAGRGADMVVVNTVTAETYHQALAAVRDGGTLLLFGFHYNTPLTLDLWSAWRREVDLVSSISAAPDDLRRALTILGRPDKPFEQLVTHTFPLAEAARAFEIANSGQAGKVLLQGAA